MPQADQEVAVTKEVETDEEAEIVVAVVEITEEAAEVKEEEEAVITVAEVEEEINF